MPVPVTSLIVDLLGFLTGTVLYVMLVAMVWRESAVEGLPALSGRARLPLLTGLCGLVWNLGALFSFNALVGATGRSTSPVAAVAFSALGFLPAVVVHALLEGRETAAGKRATLSMVWLAYGLSGVAAGFEMLAAARGLPVPSRPALWVLTTGFLLLTALLLLLTRQQPIGRRGIWVAALSVFAVSALHFGRHAGNEAWWTELIGHHASLLLALAILHQDYRFALADLFLKNAIALLLLMGASVAVLSGVIVPVWGVQPTLGAWDLRAVVFLALWMAPGLLFPVLRRLAAYVVDRAVLRRPDYDARLTEFADALESADSEELIVRQVVAVVQSALVASDGRAMDDPLTSADRRVLVTGAELKALLADSSSVLVRLLTVERPLRAVALGPLGAGRRLLSDDRHWLEAIARLASRRLDSLRVAHERYTRDVREQQMQRLATEAELRALRAQLHPHFLFNTLTTIGYLIQHAPTRAFDTLMRLTSVLRSVLRRSASDFSTLGEELDLVTAYLDIEHARFEERLHVIIDVPHDSRDLAVPTLLLQPLVENAVRHGIAPQRRGGSVRIAARRSDVALRIVVEDTGRGFDPASATTGSGIGLCSVAERLRVHYGNGAALRVHSVLTHGTTIEIDLPARPVGRVSGAPSPDEAVLPRRAAG